MSDNSPTDLTRPSRDRQVEAEIHARAVESLADGLSGAGEVDGAVGVVLIVTPKTISLSFPKVLKEFL